MPDPLSPREGIASRGPDDPTPGSLEASAAPPAKGWSGRFSGSADPAAERFTASILFDQRLAEVDIRGSIAHARMLGSCKIISTEDSELLIRGLEELLEDVRAGRVEWELSAEDIHMNVERKLKERIGEVAGHLHTGRSRNDQVATDTRLWLRDAIDRLTACITELQQTLLRLADQHLSTILPGYTHTQHAQPVLLAHHLLAYFWMFQRDAERFWECRVRVNRMPLGAGALAGTPHPIERQQVASELGFESVIENSMDAVSDRDFAIEAAAVCSIAMMHLSRLCGELVLWQSREFSFVMMDDSMTTGSSMMPQKKNPDVAELVRGKAGRVFGDLVALLTVMKGLPLTYNSDMQEDKEQLFDAVDTLESCLKAATRLLQTTTFRIDRMSAALQGDFSTATDLADYLAGRGVPFREAHEIVGQLVKRVEDSGVGLEDLSVGELQSVSPHLDEEAAEALQPRSSVASRGSFGGTSPEQVKSQLVRARELLRHSAGQSS